MLTCFKLHEKNHVITYTNNIHEKFTRAYLFKIAHDPKSCDYLYEYFVELTWLARVFVDLSLLKWEELRIDNFFSFEISVPWSVLKQGRKVLSIFKTYLRISLIRQQYKIGFRDELKNPNVIENWNIPFRNNPCSDFIMISIVPV